MKTRTWLAALGSAAAILTAGCAPYPARNAISDLPDDLYSYDAAWTGYGDPGAIHVYSHGHYHEHGWCRILHGPPGHCGHSYRDTEGGDGGGEGREEIPVPTDGVYGGGGS